jgi:thiamine-phosphate pyrophosphorylase
MAIDKKIYRILDANANRAREGLRVVEEYPRLVRDNADFTARLKALRHGITEAVACMGVDEKLIKARQSDTDVGATKPEGHEARRMDVAHVVTANLRRSQEALRVLEEYSKLVSVKSSARFKRLRFETYTLEKDIRLKTSRQTRKEGKGRTL